MYDEVYLAILTKDPLRVTDEFKLNNITYFHYSGTGKPNEMSAYATTSKIKDRDLVDRLKKLKLTEGFIMSENKEEIERWVKERSEELGLNT